jgi:hypothetical protein
LRGFRAHGLLPSSLGAVAAGLDGEREIHELETTEGLTEEGEEICLSPEEFEADEKASQSVAASANVAAEITLTESGTLEPKVVGPLESEDALTLPRSNPNNVIFINDSDEHRRLSVDLTVPPADAVEDEGPLLKCTTLVDPGGRQNITLTIGACAELRRCRRVFLLRARCRVGAAGTDRAMSNSPLKRRPFPVVLSTGEALLRFRTDDARARVTGGAVNSSTSQRG